MEKTELQTLSLIVNELRDGVKDPLLWCAMDLVLLAIRERTANEESDDNAD